MAKIITNKNQIPEYARKKIKNFSKLTDNQAILQYELNKLKRRLSKQVDYTQFIKIPKLITKSFIQEIHSIRGKQVEKFKERFATGKPLTSYEERKAKQYERATRDISKQLDEISDSEIYDYEPHYPEPDDVIDINDLIKKEKQYQSLQEYLKETGQAINPFTGEVITEEEAQQIIQAATDVSGSEDLRPTVNSVDVANTFESAQELIDNIRQYVLQEIDRAIVSSSTYKSGRERTSRSKEWINANIKKAGDMILKELDRISSSESELKRFATKFLDSKLLQQLYDAIDEFLSDSDSFYNVPSSGYFNSSEIYSLLHDGPMTLADSKRFEDEE